MELQNVKIIGSFAFSYCANLSGVSLDSVARIDRNAFAGCDNLIITAPRNSYAQEFAERNEIRFVEI